MGFVFLFCFLLDGPASFYVKNKSSKYNFYFIRVAFWFTSLSREQRELFAEAAVVRGCATVGGDCAPVG